MIVIHLVGDGPRDEATVPPLLASILGCPVQLAGDRGFEHHRYWKNNRVGGYARNLLFVIRVAIDAGASGLVAVVDRDKEPSGDRMKKLAKGREQHRSKSAPFPTALGEADPHFEAWLLDDPAGVRRGLGLPRESEIISITKSAYPKDDLDRLIAKASSPDLNITSCLARIASCVDVTRCNHAKTTGLHAFVEEVRAELGPLIASGEGGSPGPGETRPA